MGVHPRVNSHAAKRILNFLRIAFYMMRKGLISKRKLIMDMNLMMKRGKVLGKSLGNLMFHHHHHQRSGPRGFGLQDYEFSCSNSPNLVFFHVGKRKHHHHYFPCLNAHDEADEPDELPPRAVIVLPKIEFSPDSSFVAASELSIGEKLSPTLSPFSIRVSNYSSDDENDGEARQVDNEAEEFIKRFYEQLRVQSRTSLLQYQEMQYQEMLARGTR